MYHVSPTGKGALVALVHGAYAIPLHRGEQLEWASPVRSRRPTCWPGSQKCHGRSFCGGVGVRSAGTVLGFQAWLEILTGIGLLKFAVASRGRSIFPFARASGGRGLMVG